MCDAGTAVPVQGGGGGLCVVLTVSYEKDVVNFNDFIVATIQRPYSVHNIVQSCLYYLWSA